VEDPRLVSETRVSIQLLPLHIQDHAIPSSEVGHQPLNRQPVTLKMLPYQQQSHHFISPMSQHLRNEMVSQHLPPPTFIM
jgi:hypothetical protein